MNMQTAWVCFLVLLVIQAEGETCAGQNLSLYTGTVSTTNGGRICQKWTSNTPHSHMFNDDFYFPHDISAEDASNFCRNTGLETDGDDRPWCYTMDPRKPREYCNKKICGDLKYRNEKTYQGQVTQTCYEAEPVCGGLRSDPTGQLMSPDSDGDGNYDTEVDCLWTIVAPEDRRIEFQVLQMNIEPATVACFFDFLAIYDNTRHYGRYCSTSGPPIIKSRSNTLYVRFFSDNLYAYPGFIAKYTHFNETDSEGTTEAQEEQLDYPVGNIMCPADVDIGLYAGNVSVTSTGRTCVHWKDLPYTYEGSSAEDENYCRNFRYMNYPFPWCQTLDNKLEYCVETVCKGAPCGGNVTTPSGWLSGIDRDNDGNYDIYRECLWTLIAPADHGIVVNLLFLSLEESASCETENLRIYVEFSEADSFCGRPSPLPITLRFRYNLLYVQFKSWLAGGAPGPGFNLTYLHVAVNSVTVTLSKPVVDLTTETMDRGLLSDPVTTSKKRTGDPANIRSPTTAPGATVPKLTGSGCIKMFSSNIQFRLAVVWLIIGLLGLAH